MNVIYSKNDSAFDKLIADYRNDVVGTGFMSYIKQYLSDKEDLTKYIKEAISYENKPNRLNYLFDVYGLPTNMTLKERISYFQLLES